MSYHRELLIENEECHNNEDQLTPVETHPMNEDQTDAVFSRDEEVYNNKDVPPLKESQTARRQKVTKREIFLLLIVCSCANDQYNIVDLLLNIGSCIVYVFDVVTDVLNGLRYYHLREKNSEYMSYFIYTISIVVVSSIVLQVYSYIFERADIDRKTERESKRRKCCSCRQFFIFLCHVLQLAPVLRYLRVMKLGIRSLKMKLMSPESNNQDRQWHKALSDVNHIKIVESFLESAPQLVLQIYIMVDSKETPWITVISCMFSLFGFAVGYVSYQRSLRYNRSTPFQLTIIGCVLVAVYQALTVLARVAALALLLDCNVTLFLGWFNIRLLISWIFVLLLDVDYCQGCIKKTFDALVTGLGYHFTYVNVKNDNKNKCRMTLYYVETLVENVAFAVFWYYQRGSGVGFKELVIGHEAYTAQLLYAPAMRDVAAFRIMCSVPIVNIIGIIVMLIYYTCAHPHLGWYYNNQPSTTPSQDIEMSSNVQQEGGDVTSLVEANDDDDDVEHKPVQVSTSCDPIPAGQALFE